jgi:flotillin
MTLINENVGQEVNKVGLELINVNLRDITDESGYIQAIGKRAAAEAINRAKVEVAQQEREGATGEAIAVRERNVNVAKETATSAEGQKEAEQRRRITVAAMEAQAVQGELQSQRDIEITRAQRQSEMETAKKQAEQEQRIRVSEAEALAVTGENAARARMAESQAKLAEIQAESRKRSEVAAAEAARAILTAEREKELARLAKEQIVPQEIEKQRMALAAEAEAEKRRREAQGEADAITSKYEAEASGIQKVMEAKADGYRRLIESCGSDSNVGPTLLLIEQLPKLVEAQVKAIQNLKIDKITVWDSGTVSENGRGTTGEFLSGLVGSLPKLHELAAQAGIELPPALGKLDSRKKAEPPAKPAGTAKADA